MIALKILLWIVVSVIALAVLLVQGTKFWANRKFVKPRAKSIGHWLDRVVYVGLAGILTEWLFFWFAWPLRFLKRKNPFWWWLDDKITAKDGQQYIEGKGILRIYNWHLRNSLWNFKTKYFTFYPTAFPDGPGNNNILVDDAPIDKLFKPLGDGSFEKLPQDGRWIQTAGLKYVRKNKEDDPWQQNQGDLIAYIYSIVGEGLIWFYPFKDYQLTDQLMFRYSSCKEHTYKIFGIKIWKGYRTIKLGYGYDNFVLTIKHQAKKPWGSFVE